MRWRFALNRFLIGRFPNLCGVDLFVEYPKCGATWISNMYAHASGKQKATTHGMIYWYGRVAQEHRLNVQPINKVVVVLRDPRDVLISYFFHDFYHEKNSAITRQAGLEESNLKDQISKYVCLRLEAPEQFFPYFSYPQFVESWKRHKVALHVTYEDMHANPEQTLKTVCQYFGKNVSRERIQEAIDRYSFAQVSGRLSGVMDPYSHKRKGVVGDWKNYFSKETSNYVEEKWADVFEHLKTLCRRVNGVESR